MDPFRSRIPNTSHIHTYTHTHIHTHIYIYICIHRCLFCWTDIWRRIFLAMIGLPIRLYSTQDILDSVLIKQQILRLSPSGCQLIVQVNAGKIVDVYVYICSPVQSTVRMTIVWSFSLLGLSLNRGQLLKKARSSWKTLPLGVSDAVPVVWSGNGNEFPVVTMGAEAKVRLTGRCTPACILVAEDVFFSSAFFAWPMEFFRGSWVTPPKGTPQWSNRVGPAFYWVINITIINLQE